jgi:hypothetical protein
MTREEYKQRLLADALALRQKKPFYRGSATHSVNDINNGKEREVGMRITAQLPNFTKTIVTQDTFLKELDPMSHTVLFDDNMPSICVKIGDRKSPSFQEIEFRRTALNLQERIREKQTLTLCGNPRIFTLVGRTPTDKQKDNFATLKEYWLKRNQDGWGTKAVYTQKGMGDVGLLFYFNHNKEIKCRILSYEDGYVLISHDDEYGERLLETVYYSTPDGTECLDSYDDKYLYRKRLYANPNGVVGVGNREWQDLEPIEHGFSENPLCTKRGKVAWNDVQNLIDTYETLYNIFIVIEKRHGWGILYIKGKIKETAKQLAGSIVLNDTSVDGKGSAEFKTPPSPEHTIETLKTLFNNIQIGSSTTFLLPEDIKSTGDVSALAIMLTQSLDIEGGSQAVIDWQNFVSKQLRLFKEGLAKELVNKGINPNAITEYKSLDVDVKFKIWRPFNEHDYNQMLMEMKNSGIISTKTAVEKNTVSAPDEDMRLQTEHEQATITEDSL